MSTPMVFFAPTHSSLAAARSCTFWYSLQRTIHRVGHLVDDRGRKSMVSPAAKTLEAEAVKLALMLGICEKTMVDILSGNVTLDSVEMRGTLRSHAISATFLTMSKNAISEELLKDTDRPAAASFGTWEALCPLLFFEIVAPLENSHCVVRTSARSDLSFSSLSRSEM
jgi:hypothetical protein